MNINHYENFTDAELLQELKMYTIKFAFSEKGSRQEATYHDNVDRLQNLIQLRMRYGGKFNG